jgi:cysteine desulfurase
MSIREPMIDLDGNATTLPQPEVVETVARVMRDCYGNPGSRHAAGRRARQVLEDSRDSLATSLGALPEEIIFTSGGTEAINMALLGLASGRAGGVATTAAEHPATNEVLGLLQKRGWRRHNLPLNKEGLLTREAIDAAPWDDIKLATVILAHNEVGVIQEIAPLADVCRQRGIPFHVDAVQAVGKIPIRFSELGVTTLALGAHKFHGPRGIGALLVKKGTTLPPLLVGGHQERGRRPGTEPVALIAGMVTALEIWRQSMESTTQHVTQLRDRLQVGLIERCGPVVVNGCQTRRLPNTLNIAFPGCDGDALLVNLDLEGVCCSIGSACSSGSSEPAPVLVAMGCPPEVYKSSLRFSVTRFNTTEEIDLAVGKVARVVGRLRGHA